MKMEKEFFDNTKVENEYYGQKIQVIIMREACLIKDPGKKKEYINKWTKKTPDLVIKLRSFISNGKKGMGIGRTVSILSKTIDNVGKRIENNSLENIASYLRKSAQNLIKAEGKKKIGAKHKRKIEKDFLVNQIKKDEIFREKIKEQLGSDVEKNILVLFSEGKKPKEIKRKVYEQSESDENKNNWYKSAFNKILAIAKELSNASQLNTEWVDPELLESNDTGRDLDLPKFKPIACDKIREKLKNDKDRQIFDCWLEGKSNEETARIVFKLEKTKDCDKAYKKAIDKVKNARRSIFKIGKGVLESLDL